MSELLKWLTSGGIDGSFYTMKQIRIAWKIGDQEGHSLPYPPTQRKLLEAHCVDGNNLCGPNTHWIEEIEV